MIKGQNIKINIFKRCFFIKTIVAVYFYFPGIITAQSTVLDSASLTAQPVYFSIRQALAEPEKVYRLHLDGVSASSDIAAESALEKFKNLQELKISGNRFKTDTFPSFLTALNNLQILSLWYTPFKHLPSSIVKLENLKKLYITGCLVSLPGEMGQLKNLNTLYIADSGIPELPESLSDSKSLKKLYLNYTHLHKLSQTLGKLENLQLLYIAGTKISDIPYSGGQFKNLQKLKIENNHLLQSLPSGLFTIKTLKEISIVGNENLPPVFPDLSALNALEYLNISDSRCETIQGISGMKSLRYLKLSDNRYLKEIPKSIGDLGMLEEIIFQNISGALPPSVKKLKKLKRITLQNADNFNWESLAYLSSCLILTEMNLSKNNFTSLPSSLTKLSQLRKIVFTDNDQNIMLQFKWNESIKTLSNLNSLRIIDLSGNSMQTFPEAFGLFRKLDSLYIGNNNFANNGEPLILPGNLNIDYLDLKNSGLQKLPKGNGSVLLIKGLGLHGNQIDSINGDLEQFKYLVYIDLSSQGISYVSDNPSVIPKCLIYISPQFYSLKNLRYLNLSKNSCLKEGKDDIRNKLPAECIFIYDN